MSSKAESTHRLEAKRCIGAMGNPDPNCEVAELNWQQKNGRCQVEARLERADRFEDDD